MHKETPSLKILGTSGVDYVDLRSCLEKVDANHRFIPQGDHYSRNGSITIARCIIDRLPQRLWGTTVKTRTYHDEIDRNIDAS